MGGSERDVRTAPGPAADSGWVPLSDVDPELARGLPDGELSRALLAALHRRPAMQDQRLAAQGAIGQLARVEQRLLALFRLFADAWGTVSGDSVAVTVLGHRVRHGRTA